MRTQTLQSHHARVFLHYTLEAIVQMRVNQIAYFRNDVFHLPKYSLDMYVTEVEEFSR